MTAELFALTAAVILGVTKVIWTYEVRRGTDAWSMMLGICFIGSVIVALWAPPTGLFELSYYSFFLLLLNGVLWVYGDYFCLQASRFLDPSISRLSGSAQYILVFLAGIILFSEPLTLQHSAGALLILLSLIVTVRLPHSAPLAGLAWQVGGIIFIASARILDKVLTETYGVELITFTGFFIPGLLYLLLRPSSLFTTRQHLMKASVWYLFAAMLTPIAYFLLLKALAEGELSITVSILQTDMIILLILERAVFGASADIRQRCIAAVICAAGGALLLH